MQQNDFSSDFAKLIDTARSALELAITERAALAAQLAAAEKVEAEYEAEQIEFESRVMRAIGVGKSEASHLRRYVADRRREIPPLESSLLREKIKNDEWVIDDLRLTIKQLGDAAAGLDRDVAEAKRTLPTPAPTAPAPIPEILDDPGFDIVMPAPTWRTPLSDLPVTDLEVIEQ